MLARFTYTSAAAGLVFLLLPALPGLGRTINGARLWIRLGPITVQPSEVAKLLLIVFFAGYFVQKRDVLSLASRRVLGLDLPRARDLGPVLLAWGASLAVLVRGRDLGSSLLFFGIFIVMLYVATERTSWLLIGLALFGLGAVTAYGLFGHVQRRVDTWLDPFGDADDSGFQLVQGLFGFGTGGITGTGLGEGSPGTVPFAKTDFILAAIGEELGLVGVMAVLLLFALDRRARAARGAVVPRPVRQAARRRAVVRAVPAGVRHRRRRHRPGPADRRHAAVAVLRRQLDRRELGARRPAAAGQRRRRAGRPRRRSPPAAARAVLEDARTTIVKRAVMSP